MNYINNKAKYDSIFRDVFGFFFKKIGDINNEERCDFIFAEFNKQLLQQTIKDIRRRNTNNETLWLQRETTFRLLKLPQDILYINNGQTLQELFRILSKNDYKIEFRSYSIQAFGFQEMKHEHYIFIFPKHIQSPFLNNFALNHNKQLQSDKKYISQNTEILAYILQKIKEIL
jgi:hypothetical protein